MKRAARTCSFLLCTAITFGLQERAFELKKKGGVLAGQSQYREAEPYFRRACALDRREPDACYFWARTLYALDRFEDSLQALNMAEPGPRTVQARAQALDGLGRAPEAETLYKQVVALYRPRREEDPRLHYGVFLIRQGRAEEALPYLADLAETNPTFPKAHLERGRALMHTGRHAEAVTSFEAALALDPQNEQAAMLASKARQRLRLPNP